jgi:hypothetical protein
MTYRVITVNFNGLSETSDEFTFNVCNVPSGMQAPVRVEQGSYTDNLIV